MTKRFTLIELLMVVCIILILVSLLFPAFKKAKQMANLAVCSSNMKQIHMLNALYLRNNKNAFFPSQYSSCTWFGINGSRSFYCDPYYNLEITQRPLNKYLGIELKANTQIDAFLCPADTNKAYYKHEGSSYVSNSKSNYGTPRPLYKGLGEQYCRTINNVVAPGITSMIEEDVAFDVSVGIATGTTSYSETIFWHTKPGDYRWNMVMVDGSRNALMPINLGVHSGQTNGNKYKYDATLELP
jgi:Tfp pilus assembly protein PilE